MRDNDDCQSDDNSNFDGSENLPPLEPPRWLWVAPYRAAFRALSGRGSQIVPAIVADSTGQDDLGTRHLSFGTVCTLKSSRVSILLGLERIIRAMPLPADKEKWQAQYRATVEALERVRAQELASMTDERALQIIKSLHVVGTPWRQRPDWSGLVEQQAIFHPKKR